MYSGNGDQYTKSCWLKESAIYNYIDNMVDTKAFTRYPGD